MPFTTIPLSSATSGQYVEVAADGSNGNRFENDGKTRLVILNGATMQAVVCTFAIPPEADSELADGNVIADLVESVANDEPVYIVKRLPKQVYNVRSGTDQGFVTMTWTGTVSNITLVAIRL